MLSPQVMESAKRAVLCWLATADESGQPNVSPKELFALLDDEHVVIANIASPQSARNVRTNPQVCVSFVDVFSQKGYKIMGTARMCYQRDPDFDRWAAPMRHLAAPRFNVYSVIVVSVTTVETILAPSYQLYPESTTEASQIESAMKAYGVQARQAHD